MPPAKYSEKSLYALKSIRTSDAGREVKLEVLRGRLRSLRSSSPTKRCGVREKVDFLLVSIDPEHDTSEVLRANYQPGSPTQYAHAHESGIEVVGSPGY